MRKVTGSYRTYLSLVKLQPWFLSSQYKTCLWTELQPWYLSLQRKTCPWAEHSDYDDEDDDDDDYETLKYVKFLKFCLSLARPFKSNINAAPSILNLYREFSSIFFSLFKGKGIINNLY